MNWFVIRNHSLFYFLEFFMSLRDQFSYLFNNTGSSNPLPLHRDPSSSYSPPTSPSSSSSSSSSESSRSPVSDSSSNHEDDDDGGERREKRFELDCRPNWIRVPSDGNWAIVVRDRIRVFKLGDEKANRSRSVYEDEYTSVTGPGGYKPFPKSGNFEEYEKICKLWAKDLKSFAHLCMCELFPENESTPISGGYSQNVGKLLPNFRRGAEYFCIRKPARAMSLVLYYAWNVLEEIKTAGDRYPELWEHASRAFVALSNIPPLKKEISVRDHIRTQPGYDLSPQFGDGFIFEKDRPNEFLDFYCINNENKIVLVKSGMGVYRDQSNQNISYPLRIRVIGSSYPLSVNFPLESGDNITEIFQSVEEKVFIFFFFLLFSPKILTHTPTHGIFWG